VRPLRLLVLDAYDAAGRAALRGVGASEAGVLYARMLLRHAPGARVDVATPADPGPLLPAGASLADYDGLTWTGSSLSLAAPEDPRVRRQVELARAAGAAGVPCFGSCFAVQLAAVAAGGVCAPNPRGREFGIARRIRLTAAGRDHPLLAGRAPVFDAFTSHADHVTAPPEGVPVLAGNEWSPVQALAVGGAASFWAVQYHPEYDLREIGRLALLRADELVAQGRFASPQAARDWAADMEALQEDPAREDLRARLDVHSSLLEPDQREREVRNWLARVVRPRAEGARALPGPAAA
jgi:GMP synthase (glutamine-hydrolysing)